MTPSVSVVAIVLMFVAVIASAFVVYAIYRYGVIPMLRNLRNDAEFNDLWHQGGWRYRVSLMALLLAIPLAVGVGCDVYGGTGLAGRVAFLVATAILVWRWWRWQFVRRYRAGSPLQLSHIAGTGCPMRHDWDTQGPPSGVRNGPGCEVRLYVGAVGHDFERYSIPRVKIHG